MQWYCQLSAKGQNTHMGKHATYGEIFHFTGAIIKLYYGQVSRTLKKCGVRKGLGYIGLPIPKRCTIREINSQTAQRTLTRDTFM